MEIIVAKNAGFCFGVKNAIDIIMQEKNEPITLGEIIHNRIVVDKLTQNGVKVINNLEEYTSGKVIIRSHGVPKSMIDELEKRGIDYVDATCPFVKRIHEIVENNYLKGNQIVIVGESSHDEVIGTNGWCNNSAIIIDSEEGIKSLIGVEKPIVVVAQTTFSAEKYDIIKNYIKNSVKTVEFFDTICYTTRDRQREAIEMAKSCDTMLVLGSLNSSNTMKLFEICKRYCDNSYLISSICDLSKVVNLNNRLGITAGASTPEELIMEVVNVMSETQVNSTEMLNEEVAETAAIKENAVLEEVSVSEVVKVNAFEAAMKDLDSKQVVKPEKGRKVIVTVINATDKGIEVNFGSKNDAFIEKSEVEINEEDYNPANYAEGMEFKAEFIEKKDKSGMIAMSKKVIELKEIENKKFEEIINGSDFIITIEKAVKGGLISKLGPYTIFIPQSQIRLGFEKAPEKYVGKELLVRKIEGKNTDPEKKSSGRRIVASHSIILEEEKNAKEELFWNAMIPNTIVKGKVKRFTDFGAFVSVNGNDCLAHISDLSWVKVSNPSDVLELNKIYDFLILNADRNTGKVSLGYKQLMMKPYEEAAEKYPVDTVVKGTVERIFNYGAFVSIDRGVDGLVPVSEISYSYIKDANEAFTVGQEIEAKVIKFDGNKITLSVKALLPVPETAEKEVVITNSDIKENNEKRAKANAKKFENVGATSAPKRRYKKTVDNKEEEAKSWTNESTGATLGDLFKSLNFDFSNEEDK